MAQRKLQSEIDRTIKKVAEGVEGFESTYEKLYQATNQTLKDKLEGDLKNQIKKLQRMRDQIKTWASSNDIKDKSMLQENRKLIEIQMEKFKACEKEMKTKAFSKGGLIAATKLDPREKAKHEQSEWLGTMVTELERQVEQTEAELASLQLTVKKKSKNGSNGRADDLAHLNSRRQWHISRLEIVLRLLENGTLSPDQVQDLRYDVSYYVTNNQDDNFEEDDMIYEDLNLDAEEEAFGLVGDDGNTDEGSSMISDLPPRTPMKDKGGRSSIHDDDSLSGRQNDHSPVLKKQSIPLRKPAEKTEPPKAPVPIPQPNFAAQPMSSALKAGLTTLSSAPVKPAMRYSAAAGGSTSTASPIPQPPPTPTTAATLATQAVSTPPGIPPPTPVLSNVSSDPSAAATPSRSPTPSVSVPSPVASSIMPPSQSSRVSPPSGTKSVTSSGYPDSRGGSPPISSADGSPLVHSTASVSLATSPFPPAAAEPPLSLNGAATKGQTSTSSAPGSQQQPISNPLSTPAPTMSATSNGTTGTSLQTSALPNLGPSPLPQQVQQFSSSFGNRLETSQQNATSLPSLYPPGVPVSAASDRSGNAQTGNVIGLPQQAPSRPVLPGSLGDLVQSFEQVKSKAAQRMSNPDQVNQILEKSIIGTPQAHDTEKPKYYAPRNPYSTPPYYPQTPLSNLSSPALFTQLDVETLFYIFYFLPGTYMQYLAAHELKKQSWRFHVKYLTWFQRHSEPQAITEEYEQGVYVYFDWEGSWCQRKKSDFRFEYRYLSED